MLLAIIFKTNSSLTDSPIRELMTKNDATLAKRTPMEPARDFLLKIWKSILGIDLPMTSPAVSAQEIINAAAENKRTSLNKKLLTR